MDLKDKKKYKNRDFVSSFEFAKSGLITVFKEERNMRKHAVVALLAIVASIFFQITRIEWLFIIIAVFLVLILEIINTAIENAIDLSTDYHFHVLAKNAKDMAAGAVLLASILAVIIGLIVFIPYIIQFLQNIIKFK